MGTGIKAGQEVIYSKIIRKIMRADNKSWMHLVIFSLLTAAFDDGLGAWYGEHKHPQDQGFKDVAMEFPRPLLSCLAINYIMASSYMGLHNPMRSFGLKDLLIALAAKDAAEGRLVPERQRQPGRDRAVGQLHGQAEGGLTFEQELKISDH